MYDYDELYDEFEKMYNPYPVQMSRCEAFKNALHDGYITEEQYKEARDYFGNLWNYTGD